MIRSSHSMRVREYMPVETRARMTSGWPISRIKALAVLKYRP